jgi:hypothetical protein
LPPWWVLISSEKHHWQYLLDQKGNLLFGQAELSLNRQVKIG